MFYASPSPKTPSLVSKNQKHLCSPLEAKRFGQNCPPAPFPFLSTATATAPTANRSAPTCRLQVTPQAASAAPDSLTFPFWPRPGPGCPAWGTPEHVARARHGLQLEGQRCGVDPVLCVPGHSTLPRCLLETLNGRLGRQAVPWLLLEAGKAGLSLSEVLRMALGCEPRKPTCRPTPLLLRSPSLLTGARLRVLHHTASPSCCMDNGSALLWAALPGTVFG